MTRTTAAAAAAGLLAGLLFSPLACRATPDPAGAAAPVFDDAFWGHWGDGRAELSGYDLTTPRYGHSRTGVAVLIFVTETFSDSLRVKADPGRHSEADQFPVMKLNLVKDFSTGIYDYNLMTSAFVALQPVNGLPAGTPTKISFSAQEWCGMTYEEALIGDGRIRYQSNSYFDGEADQSGQLDRPDGALEEDALLLWARGLAVPVLAPGESRDVPMLRSLEDARLHHKPLDIRTAHLARSPGTHEVTVPAGTFVTHVLTAGVDDGPTWTFYVEADPPHRIVRWTTSTGEEGSLLGGDRLKYWEMHDPGGEAALAKLGLSPRPPRTP